MARIRKKSSSITSHDVARKAGVSQATVSLALRGSNQVSQKRIEQIRKLATKMGYFPRAAGQMLRNRKTGYMGLIMAAKNPETVTSSGFMGPILARFVRSFSEQQTPYMVDFHHHDSAEHTMPRQIASGLVDGVYIVGDVGCELMNLLQQRSDFPWVSLGEHSNYCVLNDADHAIEKAIDHLYELGHRRIAYAGGPEMYQEHLESRLAFEQGLNQRQITCKSKNWIQVFQMSDIDPNYGKMIYQWATSLLKQKNRPTAIICHSEPFARTVLYAAAQLGINVPDELSIISWGWGNEASRRYPTLCTLAYDIESIVSHATDLMDQQIKQQNAKPQTHRIPMQLLIGQTTGKSSV